MKRKAVLAAAAILAIIFITVFAGGTLGLDDLKSNLHAIRQWRDASPALAAALFFAAYVLVTSLSLPFASLMTLAAGAIFGVLFGTVIVSFASTAGATLAFIVARFLLRDAVQSRFGGRLAAVNKGIALEGGFYLFSLRLIPVLPFFVVNLVMGVSPIKTRTFFWTSQLGMLPATLVYVNAGTQIANLQSMSGILSPSMLGSFAILAGFPWIAKAVLSWWKRRRVYRNWERPKSFDRNLVVIGGGAAGLVSAYVAAAVKAKVTLVEAHKMGGDCLNYGCVPSKALIKSAKLAEQMRRADKYGLQPTDASVTYRAVFARVKKVIEEIAPHDSAERYRGLGVEVLEGHARIVDPWTVRISFPDGTSRDLTTRSIILATGAAPFVPPLPGIEKSGCLTSDTLWERFAEMDRPPRRIAILGGGPIGSELAQALARLGSRVTQIEMADRILVREDPEVSECACRVLEADGVEVLTGHKAISVGKELSGEKYVEVESGGLKRRVSFDELICAVGRAARLEGYGLKELGIPAGRTLKTNEYLETLYPNIFAAGDVAGPYQFTHVAAHQAWYASVNALFGFVRRFKADYSVIPWTTFVDPEVARVGLNEQEATERGVPFEVTRFEMKELDRAIADSAIEGFVKVLTVPGKDRILGVTIVGEHAGDLIAEYVLAMKHGLGLNKILGTIHTYPTLSEANKYAAGEWKKAHVPTRVLSIIERIHAWRLG